MNRLQRLTGEGDRGAIRNPARPGKARGRGPRRSAPCGSGSTPSSPGGRRGRGAWTPPAGRGRGVPLEELVSGRRDDQRGGGLLLRPPPGRGLLPPRAVLHPGSDAPRHGQAGRPGQRPGPAGTGLPRGPLPRHGNDGARRRDGDGGLPHRPGLVRGGCLRHAAALRPGLRRGAGDAPRPSGTARGKSGSS